MILKVEHMSDVMSQKQRSDLMARVRGSGNASTEMPLAKILRAAHLSGWRRHHQISWQTESLAPALRKTQQQNRFRASVVPDFVFRQNRTVLFIDGCFWHFCPMHGTVPSSNVDYWHPKLLRNRLRDRFVDSVLCNLGWTVLRVWEHALQDPERLTRWLARHLSPQ